MLMNRSPSAAYQICVYLSFRVRHKQNKYPILFLTQGISVKYPELMDIRCQTTQIAVSFAQSENILVSDLYTVYCSCTLRTHHEQCEVLLS